MADSGPATPVSSFLGTGWSFPPTFRGSGVVMTSDEDDVRASLDILFHTAPGERFLRPDFGIDVRSLLFDPMSTTLRTFLADRVETAILIHEPRIKVVDVTISSPNLNDGTLQIRLDYEIRSTNSRFNLVFPFYLNDANEVRGALRSPGGA
jgi:phage baseplate assembly protein W